MVKSGNFLFTEDMEKTGEKITYVGRESQKREEWGKNFHKERKRKTID